MRKAALHNLGCKVNAYETEAMEQLLKEAGYTIVPFEDIADVYIINTCTVTNIADRKSRQMLHRAKKRNPEAVVVATGCYVQVAGASLYEDGAIDLVIGNNRKKDLVPLLEEFFQGRREAALLDIHHTREYENLSLNRAGEHTRAYVKVQDGCNQFCSYCIIPYARGRVRSRQRADVIEEIRCLGANGYQEVVLTGIHLSSYGVDLEQESLLGLIQAVHQVEGICRIRLGSLEPGIVTEEFAGTLASLPKVCPHFHLSLQSGCDATLRRMNRRYTAAEYEQKCQLLRRCFENPALTTDVIVGFPGETEEEFAVTREFLERVCFYETHIFKYSRRKGTRADQMPDQIPEPVKARRSGILQELNEKNRRAYQERFLGRQLEVLLEEPVEYEGHVYQTGHTREYLQVAVEMDGRKACVDEKKGGLTGEQVREGLGSNRIIRVRAKEILGNGMVLGE
ncbi:MAG: tRNA (N(6)-L-threonylcarbamoyladenosine(37)-C(2))-methylthiotransferase MtaB [Lachnospiraceae bacterium]|nr:tRNA (N(6)-L-threonylcarbamoyladenosine(37)-C(2))-methylthiotransferase MtaB [Lachnospiraceae bacterium]